MDRESKVFTVFKWVLGLGLAYAASFFVLGVIKGIVGIVIAVVVGTIAIQAWPLFQFALGNLLIAGWKVIAREAPITSMQNIEISKSRELELYRGETQEIETQTRSFQRMVEEVESQYPGEPETLRLREQLQMLEASIVDRRRNEADAEQALAAFRQTIRKMEMMWKASQAGLKASKRAKMKKKDFERLVLQTSMDTVQQSMDRCFAQLAADRAKAEQQRAALPPAAVRTTLPAITAAKQTATIRR